MEQGSSIFPSSGEDSALKTAQTGCWTFFCNPRVWQVDEFLSSGTLDDNYRITNWQAEWFDAGQIGVVRVGGDTRTKEQLAGKSRLAGGIYAIVQVLGKPKRGQGSADLYWLEAPPADDDRLTVDIRYVRNLIDTPLLLDSMELDPAVTDRYLLEGYQAASMPLDPGTLDRVLELTATEPHVFDAIATAPGDSLNDLERKYAAASPQFKAAISRRIERGPVASKVKEATGYRCQICQALGSNPFAFAKKDGTPYVEAHHVTFVSMLVPGTLGPSNIITICANHHRQLHYGDAELRRENRDEFIFRLDQSEVRVPRNTVQLER